MHTRELPKSKTTGFVVSDLPTWTSFHLAIWRPVGAAGPAAVEKVKPSTVVDGFRICVACSDSPSTRPNRPGTMDRVRKMRQSDDVGLGRFRSAFRERVRALSKVG